MSKRSKYGPRLVFFSGPMRDHPDWNYPLFHEVEQAWQEQFPEDATLNPAKNFDGDTTRSLAEYMQASLAQLVSAHAIVLLPGWESSEGSAEYEVPVARVTSKIFYLAIPKADGGWGFDRIDSPDVPHAGYATEFTPAEPEPSVRAKLLLDSIEAIDGDRNAQYGPPTQDFKRTADMANAWGFRVGEQLLESHHVAIFQEILKISRKRWSPGKRDHWLDTSGYSGCGWECVVEEGNADDL